MLHLYTSAHCPYCKKVAVYLDEASIPFETRNVSENTAFRDELIAKGGKMQIPFLVDTERGVTMYESDDIIAYAREHYASVPSDEK